ncbi:MAG: hypothetical protein ACK4NY_10335 [Spirosomataceae bacterium]
MKIIGFTYLILLISNGLIGQQTYKTQNFVIHYNTTDVPVNGVGYVSPRTSHVDSLGPHYIQDMGEFLQKAFDTYASLGLCTKKTLQHSGRHLDFKVDTLYTTIDVYVQELKDDSGNQIDGKTSLSSVSINNLIPPEKGLSVAQLLQKTCTHELLHYVTLTHYSSFAAGTSSLKEWWRKLDFGTKWWWEVLAVQGDRIVYPLSKPYEADYYAQDATVNLEAVLHRSWDDCNEEPNWYTAGGFISYLIHHRPKEQASFKEIFIRPSQSKTSYTRTVLDEYVKEKLKSNGLGWEYHDYIKWNYENNGFARIDNDILAVRGNAHTTMIRLTDSKKNSDTVTREIPYMSGFFFRIRNEDSRSKSVVIKNLSETQNLVLYAYEVTVGNKKFLKNLDKYSKKDSLIVKLDSKAKWLDILALPTGINGSENAIIAVNEIINAEGDYKGNIDFADDNKSMKSRYTIKISDLNFIVDINNRVKGTLNFYMDYKNDGMIAKASDFNGTVKPDGSLEISGVVAETNFPKCDKDCCTYDKIVQGVPCFKFNKNLYWHFSGKVKIKPDSKKEMKGEICVSRKAQLKKEKPVLIFQAKTF